MIFGDRRGSGAACPGSASPCQAGETMFVQIKGFRPHFARFVFFMAFALDKTSYVCPCHMRIESAVSSNNARSQVSALFLTHVGLENEV